MDAETIREIFRSLGTIHISKMFGGQGVYQGELMFALEAYGDLYLKTDDESVGTFREMGSRPFVYEAGDGRKTTMSYWLMPESALDDPDEARELASMALGAAQRAKSPQRHQGGCGQEGPEEASETRLRARYLTFLTGTGRMRKAGT